MWKRNRFSISNKSNIARNENILIDVSYIHCKVYYLDACILNVWYYLKAKSMFERHQNNIIFVIIF